MRVLLVGNYEFDGSTSMKIWADTLLRELLDRGVAAELIVPKPIFGRLKSSPVGFGKWLGYIDRFLLFPLYLRARAADVDVVHICDHGSAMFTLQVTGKPIIVTCHDLLAVRGALGEIAEMRASPFGRLLQRWVCRGLERATRVACVSEFTLQDAQRILRNGRNLCKVLNGLNYPFQPIEAREADRRLAHLPEIQGPFLLHVGSSHPRKNRDGVMRVFKKAAQQADLQLVFAGQELNEDLMRLARELEIDGRMVQVVNPTVETIEALYNMAVALLFPSRHEGFGWPAIEAQACGCPVVASEIPPLKETLGESAALHPLDDEDGMAGSVVRIASDSAWRRELRRRGLENVRSRFQTARMMDDYLDLYQQAAPGVDGVRPAPCSAP